MKEKTCCFTGHRSQKLPWGFNEENEQCIVMKGRLYKEIEIAVLEGYEIFISGMAIGFDTICAETVLMLKNKYPNIKLHCVLPCQNQDKFWSNYQRQRYRNILAVADKVVVISENYTSTCMFERNNYMVDNSSKVIALYNGRGGGTKKTIDYAKSKGLLLTIIEP